MGQLVGHRVVVVMDRDVVVDVHAGPGPLAVDEGRRRQRPQGGLVQAREQLAPAGAVQAHAPAIEVGEQLGDCAR